MLYCCNPQCGDPFNPEGVRACLNCGYKSLSPIFHHRYQVVQVLGEGGFGKTYKALDIEKMNHPCVIKQLTISQSGFLEKAKELFQKEAKRLYELGQHEQIPSLLAHFEENNKLYLVQEYIAGKDLYTEFEQEGRFSEKKIRQLLTNFLPVLEFIHDNNIIHRDIKPQNIMRRDGSEQLVLIDFGIAKELNHPEVNIRGTIIGTPGYAPPEQIVYGKVSPASDLYNLGITCIRLVTGNFTKIDIDDYPSESSKKSGRWSENLPINFDKNLIQVLEKLTEIDLNKRYHSAKEVLNDLKSTNPPPPPPIPDRKASKNRQTRTINNDLEVSGIILEESNREELVQIAQASVSTIEARLDGQTISHGGSFIYKQLIRETENKSRFYFLTTFPIFNIIFESYNQLKKLVESGKRTEEFNFNFTVIWNNNEYKIEEFLLPKTAWEQTTSKPQFPSWYYALFYLDIETTKMLDFFGLSSQCNLSRGDKIYIFAYSSGPKLSVADGTVSHIYKQYGEEINNPLTNGIIQHNIVISHGNSGVLTVNEYGEIVGISTGDYPSSVAGGLNLSLNISSVLEQLKDSNNFQLFNVPEYLKKNKEKISSNL